MKTILLKFAGPLQSWGTNSHFETRHTDFHPSKSAIVGLIGASFGYARDDDGAVAKLNQLNFAVRVDQSGSLMRDYHTAHAFKSNGQPERTYVTNRYYLEDAVFVVALGHSDDAWIDEIEFALKNPYYQPFMGRRSLPLTADMWLGTTNQGVIDALKSVEWQASQWYQKKGQQTLIIYADADLIQCGSSPMRRDRVISFSQKERKFGFRSETSMQIEIANNCADTNHDAFAALGE